MFKIIKMLSASKELGNLEVCDKKRFKVNGESDSLKSVLLVLAKRDMTRSSKGKLRFESM